MNSDHSRSSPAFAIGFEPPLSDMAFGRPPVRMPSLPRLVIIESPFAGDVPGNIAYAKRAVHDCLMRGEAPLCSHLLFTQPGILDDLVPGERALGIEAGLAWYRAADLCAVYQDRGVSSGMQQGIARARDLGVAIETRSIGG